MSAASFFLLHPLRLHTPKTAKNNNKIAHTIGDNLKKKKYFKESEFPVNYVKIHSWLHEHTYSRIDLRTLRLIDSTAGQEAGQVKDPRSRPTGKNQSITVRQYIPVETVSRELLAPSVCPLDHGR